MAYIYPPKGKAGEYGELALNIFKGCSHGCKYCYVPPILYQTPEQFHSSPEPRALDFRVLNREMELHKGKQVFLCFTCDPYQPANDKTKMTCSILQRFRLFDISPVILTKGGLRSVADFDLLAKDPQAKYGATLTFLNEKQSLEWEPGAASPQDRIKALQEAHLKGIRTWASLEPVIDPAQSLQIIRETHGFIDEFKIGRWNHDPEANKIDWKTFAEESLKLCQSLGKKVYIKKDLAAFIK